ncbi:MerR family transcriptional regulator [Nocardioides sp.]|uniref:MerR family transcriptional regulator n=1 Tax=Nocardioides sp. TaxID=35761 RepID=UPI0027370F0B|nr:MerR family transcriptional regulator [Nocardioides sp.]MDP3889593.1 MerR family transcriptional regulator [Nocardioides sp.]
MSAPTLEMTIDQLAARVGMTVRNVRAYAGRGLIPAPRLVGRTGYYNEEHAARLRLIRDLIDRGYTLTAVERTLAERTTASDGHALDLLTLLANPLGQTEESEDMTIEVLTHLAGVEHDEEFLGQLEDLGLLERLDSDSVRLLRPVLVRAGAQALSLGLARPTVLGLLQEMSTSLETVANRFVEAFRNDVWHPFIEAGMPTEQWPTILASIEALLPTASRAVIASFRDELVGAIESALGEELAQLSGEQVGQLFGSD